MQFLKPKALVKGDVIHVVASSSPFEREAFLQGVKVLESFGFGVSYQADIFSKQYYLAGSDQRRFQELKKALTHKNVKAVFFARGGYGAMRLLPELARLASALTPKIILGYSDVTALLLYFQRYHAWTTFYGPVVAKDLSQQTHHLTLASLYQSITNTHALDKMQFDDVLTLKAGNAEGIMVGGCLSLIVALLGTPYEIDTQDKILFLEDTKEKPYQIDRMLMHLKLAGKFDKCRGIIFGSLATEFPAEYYIQTIQDVIKQKIPILFNFPAGHSAVKMTLPLGVKVKISTRQRSLVFLESALCE